ncbi:MAG: glycosyltransferase [Chloroflexota bacterium]|nr:glycosyltransferase [Chloroflexota bacterium]
MKVLQILPSLSPSWGGPVSVVSGLTGALTQQGIQCSVVSTFGLTGDKPAPPPGMSAALFPTDVFGWLWIGHAPGLASAVRREISNCDLVHIHELWHYPHWVATRIAWARGVPFIISPHGELSAWGLRQKAWAKRIYGAALLRPSLRRAHTLHALSEAEARQIRDYGVDARVVVVPNGVPPKILKTTRDKRAVRASFPQLRGKQVVLFLGRLHTQKGPDVMI